MDVKYRWERLTASAKVSLTPVNVVTIIITPHTGKQAEATFYDGESTSDPEILHVHTGSGQSKVFNFPFLLSTQRGLYVDFTGDVDEIFLLYDSKKE